MEIDDDHATMREGFSLVQNILFIGYTKALPAHQQENMVGKLQETMQFYYYYFLQRSRERTIGVLEISGQKKGLFICSQNIKVSKKIVEVITQSPISIHPFGMFNKSSLSEVILLGETCSLPKCQRLESLCSQESKAQKLCQFEVKAYLSEQIFSDSNRKSYKNFFFSIERGDIVPKLCNNFQSRSFGTIP